MHNLYDKKYKILLSIIKELNKWTTHAMILYWNANSISCQ